MTGPAGTPGRRLGVRLLAEGSWLRLEQIDYLDPEGRPRRWEAAERCGSAQAVAVIATLRPSGRAVLVQQYRPPVDAPVLEFPAGLIDPGESAAEAALRELREETGYSGTIRRLLPPCHNTPGLTSEAAAVAIVDIDETLPENHHPLPANDDDERIEVFTVAPTDMAGFLAARQAAGVRLDIKIAMRFLETLDSLS